MLILGCSYRELDRRYGKRSTVNKYFLKWASQGLFKVFFENFVDWLNTQIKDSNLFFILDASDLPVQGLNHNETEFSYKHSSKRCIKITLVVNQDGLPAAVSFNRGNLNDAQCVENVFKTLPQNDCKDSPNVVLGDKGYDTQLCRQIAQENHCVFITPAKMNSKRGLSAFEKKLLEYRYQVEHTFKKLFNFKRIKNIFDKTLSAYSSWVYLGLGMLIVRHLMKL
jgi:transposase